MSDPRVYQTAVSSEVTFDADSGDKFVFTPATPVELIRAGITGTSAYTHGSGLVIALDINSSDGDGTYTRGDGDAGTITADSGFDAGLVNYIEMDERIRLKPGDQLIFQTTTLAGAGDGVCWVEFRRLPFQHGSTEDEHDLLVNATEV